MIVRHRNRHLHHLEKHRGSLKPKNDSTITRVGGSVCSDSDGRPVENSVTTLISYSMINSIGRISHEFAL